VKTKRLNLKTNMKIFLIVIVYLISFILKTCLENMINLNIYKNTYFLPKTIAQFKNSIEIWNEKVRASFIRDGSIFFTNIFL